MYVYIIWVYADEEGGFVVESLKVLAAEHPEGDLLIIAIIIVILIFIILVIMIRVVVIIIRRRRRRVMIVVVNLQQRVGRMEDAVEVLVVLVKSAEGAGKGDDEEEQGEEEQAHLRAINSKVSAVFQIGSIPSEKYRSG